MGCECLLTDISDDEPFELRLTSNRELRVKEIFVWGISFKYLKLLDLSILFLPLIRLACSCYSLPLPGLGRDILSFHILYKTYRRRKV